MINVAVSGALGRMGTTIGRIVDEAPDLELVGGIDIREGSFFGKEVVPAARIDAFLKEKKPDVLIDFTVAAAAVENIRAAAANNVALIVGTTGFSPEQREIIRSAVEERSRGDIEQLLSASTSSGNSCVRLPALRRLRYRGHGSPPPLQEGCPERHRKDYP